MNRKTLPLALPVFLALSLGIGHAAGEKWFHVRVEHAGERPESVKINVPLSLVERLVPLIEVDELSQGRVKLDHADMNGVDLQKMWEAVRTTQDAEFVTVES